MFVGGVCFLWGGGGGGGIFYISLKSEDIKPHINMGGRSLLVQVLESRGT